ncbi:MAG: hypothetical protein U5P41_05375 [Gammaproteobacteria bacterium]|nr:hypothetical protein [Gammaproteobacteria bacterium]
MIRLLAEELMEHGSLTSKNIAGIIGRGGNVTGAGGFTGMVIKLPHNW